MCVHSSAFWVWKAYVFGCQWLNDTTYWPNSHSGSCAHLKKSNMRGNTTNRELFVSVRLQVSTFRFRVWPSLMLPRGQNRPLFIFCPTYIIWLVFTSATWKVIHFKTGIFLNPTLFLSYLRRELRPKMVNVRKGVAWSESHKRERERERATRGSQGGERLKQDRAEPHTSFHSCFYLSSLRLTGNALHSFHENFFFYGKRKADY